MSNAKNDCNQKSDQLCEAQSIFFGKLDYHKVFSDKKEVIRHFIESENEAKEYVFQGKFYPMAHYEIQKIVKTKMSGFDEKEIIQTFYHCLRLGSLYKIDEVNYPYLQRAIQLLLPDLQESKYLVCSMDRQVIYLLFEARNENDAENIFQTNYTTYSAIREFILQAGSYSHLPGMRKSHKKFTLFLENKLFLNRVQNAVILFSENKFHQKISPNFYFYACVLLLLLSEDEESKKALLQLHKQQLSNHLVWVLGSFYKEFQNTTANKELLNHLYSTYPSNWIDEYQEKKYDWENA
ncbi:hypothetical protein [Flavobacterium adhaerens]|uniref:hypothetical protein n=1 Tax=Flavobacterium adhaerens TaxID=3149043 RepID=UPI0032B5BBDF